MMPYLDKIKKDLTRIKKLIKSCKDKGIDVARAERAASLVERMVKMVEKKFGDKR